MTTGRGAASHVAAALALSPQPLTADAFAPFGTVIAAPPQGRGRPINGGTTERFDLVDDLQLQASGGRAQLALFRAQARRFPHAVTEMERHDLGSQSFIPLGVLRFIVVVAPAGDAPESGALVAFLTDGHQGVTLAPGTWHHALLAVDAGDFAVIERAAPQVDCDVHALVTPALLHPPG
ncbi:ureidoglycolate lyase [Pseudacidovorax intermedius]|uniref:ureidoglycolate lyase n=1 Tax=Pseudacidovorax intermedius TaxID=433924 RepID=UPI00034CC6AD|nr:ureidoglycolate lyase [Pseudacidovorax intermedius]